MNGRTRDVPEIAPATTGPIDCPIPIEDSKRPAF